ncbi:class I SAM-dependent methyltransferase [Pseudoroseicyclus sp. H15]
MAYDYEQLYQTTPHALGRPTQVFVDFFAARADRRLRILDVGCGQGRDALFIGRAGHSVLGIDLSPSGIRALNKVAKEENLDAWGVVADITDYEPDGLFDVVLIDRTLHMLDGPDRIKALCTLLDHVDNRGWCLIADERANIAGFKDVVASRREEWGIVSEQNGYLFLRRS